MVKLLLRLLVCATFLGVRVPSAVAEPVCGSWVQLSSDNSPSARLRHAFAYDTAIGKGVLFGGTTVSGSSLVVLGDTWLWNSATRSWQGPLSVSSAPANRYGSAMAYDFSRNVVVLFGGAGADNIPLADTWEFDGTTWREVTPPGSPSARVFHALTYNSATNQIVLFGGLDGQSLVSDTWGWNGSQWTQMQVSGPSGRELHALAYDPIRNRTTLFGGFQSNGYLGDTWESDGTAWTQKSQSGPLPRIESPLTYDPKLQRLLLFGGRTQAGVTVGDTWTWDGASWQESSIAGPGVRRGAAATYDEQIPGIVLFGGTDDRGNILQDTWNFIVPDLDRDGIPDCTDQCQTDSQKSLPGACGCGIGDRDSDNDGVLDCMESCPNDPLKLVSGLCGCGVADRDNNRDGIVDCQPLQLFSRSVSPRFGSITVSRRSVRLLMQKYGTARSVYQVTVKGPGARGKAKTYKTSRNLLGVSKLRPGSYVARFRITQKVGRRNVTSRYSQQRKFVVR